MDVARILIRTKVHDIFNFMERTNINGELFVIKVVENMYGPLQWCKRSETKMKDSESESDDEEDDFVEDSDDDTVASNGNWVDETSNHSKEDEPSLMESNQVPRDKIIGHPTEILAQETPKEAPVGSPKELTIMDGIGTCNEIQKFTSQLMDHNGNSLPNSHSSFQLPNLLNEDGPTQRMASPPEPPPGFESMKPNIPSPLSPSHSIDPSPSSPIILHTPQMSSPSPGLNSHTPFPNFTPPSYPQPSSLPPTPPSSSLTPQSSFVPSSIDPPLPHPETLQDDDLPQLPLS